MAQVKLREDVKVHVGDSMRDAANRVLHDIARFESGENVEERHVTFENWQALFNVLTPKRYELLCHVHAHPEPSVRALARALDRDFKRVYEDVKALVDAGLLAQGADGLRAEYDRIETAIPL
jgi:predicted transcriptional regulator